MTDPARMNELRIAWATIQDASWEEKTELFRWEISELENNKEQLEKKANRFHPHSWRAYNCMDTIEHFFRRTTGYNAGWVPEYFLKYASEKAGRRPKYGWDMRERNCIFISMMVNRGASETQAMKLLMRLLGNKAMAEGLLRELRDTYKDFKALGRPTERDHSILYNSTTIPYFLEFDISNLEGEEKASLKAAEAFRGLFRDLISMMKADHEKIAEKDRSYPEIFGPVIDWLNSEYDDPLDYFFTHESHEEVPFQRRRWCLTQYINSMGFVRGIEF